MPVLITGATGTIGRALADRLVQDGAEVRAYLRRDDAALRAAGVHIAVGSSEEVQPLEAALTNVHTIVHLIGGWWPEAGVSFDLLNRDSTETAAIAAKAARVKRFVFISFPGADPGSPNEFLAAKGKAEEHVLASGVPAVIFRCAPIAGAGAPFGRALRRMQRAGIPMLPGRADRLLSVLALEDVIDAIVAADSREEHISGVFDLGGPEPVPLADIVAAAGIGRPFYAGRLAPGPRAFADLLDRDIVVDPTETATRFGLSLRPAVRR